MSTFTRLVSIGLLVCTALAGIPARAGDPSPDEILRRSDEIRNPSESYVMKVKVTSSDADPAVYDVSLSGNSRTLVKTLEPARDKGRNLLMLDEQMWAYIPNLKRAVRVPMRQKLTGQAANGDISRMRWSGDYDATIEKEDAQAWVLHLHARKKGLTYDQLRVWIHKADFHPLKAEYLTLQGKPLKLATFTGYRMLAGKVRPTLIRIQDALRPSERSTIQIEEMTVKHVPLSLFQQSNLQ
jgi:outer membrane lipoprotein-sorting protein